MTDTFLKAGVLGAGLIALAWFIMYLMKQHRAERKEWMEKQEAERKQWLETQEKQFDRMNDVTDESNKVLRENTNILSGLKTLLENRK